MKPTDLRVAVLGSGPSGLLAAHATALYGIQPDVLSVKTKSRTGGAMYLHQPIPELSTGQPEGFVTYRMMGDAATYARKVYGSEEAESIASFNKFKNGSTHPAWNLITAYDALWERWEPYIIDLKLGAAVVDKLLEEYHLILSTVPAESLCYQPGMHEFPRQAVWIAPECVSEIDEGEVVYNGTEEGSWYRQSNLWGWAGTEWGAGVAKPPLEGVVTVNKPVSTNCDCFGDRPGFARFGRYGRWDKNVLTHHAFADASDFLQEVFDAL